MIIRLKSYNFKAQYNYVVILYLLITHIIMGAVLSIHALRNILAPYNSVPVFLLGSRSLSSIDIYADNLPVYSKNQESLMMYHV